MTETNPHKILIAEDNLLNQRVIKSLLLHRGFDVVVVGSGQEAIEALEKSEYDLLILDCLMPGMDGFETARAIRNAEPTSLNTKIPILATTALATRHDHQRCVEAGMDEYLSKPLRAGSLYALVEHLINGHTTVSPPNNNDQAAPPKMENIVNSMAERLVREAAAWGKTLRISFENGNWNEIRELAHKIRGTASIVGYPVLLDHAEKLEIAASAPEPATIAALVPKVVDDLHRMGEEVEKKE